MKETRQIVRSISALILSICMVITLIPSTAWAADEVPAEPEKTSVTAVESTETLPENAGETDPSDEDGTLPEDAEETDDSDKAGTLPEDAEESSNSDQTSQNTAEVKKESNSQISKAAQADFTYTTSGTNATITKYNGEAKYLTIPAKIGSYKVVAIGKEAFYRSDIKSVIIPEGVTSIEDHAFYYCDELTSLNIPSTVSNMGRSSFHRCDCLASIKVAEGNQFYDSRNNCNAIIDTYGSTLIVGSNSTVIPNSVKSIGSSAFSYLENIKSTTIPGSVKSIDSYAFENCSALERITFNCGVEEIGSYAFARTSIKEVVLPKGLKNISRCAFAYCKKLKSVFISQSVSSIEIFAFSGCSDLSRIRVASGNSVYDSRKNCNAIIEKSTDKLIAGCKNTTIPKSVVSIGRYAFEDCYKLKSMIIPSNIYTIDHDAFCDCYALETLIIPSSVKEIDEDAFYNCYNLTIYGNKGSYAQKYAAQNEIRFSTRKIKITSAVFPKAGYAYTGKKKKPSVKINDFGYCMNVSGLKAGRDYTVSYKNNVKVGTATAIIRGKGFFKGRVKATFKIVPKKAAVSGLTSGRKRLSVRMTTKPGRKAGTAYQIAYKSGKAGKWKYTTTTGKTKVISKLRKGRRYYIKARAYKTIGKTKYYGAWSKTKLSGKIK